MTERQFIGAIDQGSSSSRFLVFAADDYELITQHQIPIKLISTQPGLVLLESN